MAKTKSHKKSASKNRRYLPFSRVFYISLLLILLVGSLGWFFHLREAHEVNGTARLSQHQLTTLSTKEKYQSLDLRIAKLAVYKGAPLKITQDLGMKSGVHWQIFSYPVYSDNLTEYGLLSLPPGNQPATGWPIVILLHGYINPPRYKTALGYTGQMAYFSQHGFAVLKPDLRGQGLSIKAGRPEGAYFSMAYNTDVLSLVASVKVTATFNGNAINFWGHSMGAYIALRAAVISPDIKTAVLLSGPVGSLRDMYADYVPPSDRSNPIAQLIKNTVIEKYGSPDSNPDFWNNASPTTFVGLTSTRFQIHVGGQDKTVPPEFSASFDQLLSQLNKPHQYFFYPDANHGLDSVMTQVTQRSFDFMQKN